MWTFYWHPGSSMRMDVSNANCYILVTLLPRVHITMPHTHTLIDWWISFWSLVQARVRTCVTDRSVTCLGTMVKGRESDAPVMLHWKGGIVYAKSRVNLHDGHNDGYDRRSITTYDEHHWWIGWSMVCYMASSWVTNRTTPLRTGTPDLSSADVSNPIGHWVASAMHYLLPYWPPMSEYHPGHSSKLVIQLTYTPLFSTLVCSSRFSFRDSCLASAWRLSMLWSGSDHCQGRACMHIFHHKLRYWVGIGT